MFADSMMSSILIKDLHILSLKTLCFQEQSSNQIRQGSWRLLSVPLNDNRLLLRKVQI